MPVNQTRTENDDEHLGLVFRLGPKRPDNYDNEVWIFDVTSRFAKPIIITYRQEEHSPKISVNCDPERYFIARPKILGELLSREEMSELKSGQPLSNEAYKRVIDTHQRMERARKPRYWVVSENYGE